MKRQAKSVFREFTPAEKQHLANLRKKLDAERPEIEATGRALLAAHQSAKKLIAELKAERVNQGLSLADIKKRTGITREAISAMENSDSPNPTIKTLQRYALALGVELEMKVK
jgi:DNA-binding phage protein